VDVSTLPQAPGRLPPLCGRCGYSFQGLTEIRACPECGQPVTARSRAAAFTDNIASAGSGFLLLIAAGLYMCALSAVALTVLVFYDPLDPATSAAVRTLLAVVWAAGCWVMTWPRPVRPGFEDPADKEWRGLRLATRWTQPLWPLAYGMAYLAVSSANAGLVTVASVSHLVLLALAGISIAFPAGYGMGLADWAGDSGLRERLRWVVWAAFCIPAYVPHRQRLPPNAWSISAFVGLGFFSTSAAAATMKPGVQKPHCCASCSMNCSCTACMLSGVPSPSTVVIFRPTASTASIEQEYAGLPSTKMVHAPHVPRSHTFFDPV